MTNIFNDFKNKIEKIIQDLNAAGELPGQLDLSKITAEPPRDPSHGDISTNVAMVLSKQVSLSPKATADIILPIVSGLPYVQSAETVGPGFINLRSQKSMWQSHLAEILNAGTNYGFENIGKGEPINVEFVSANPTGPMHVGHGRGAVFGDTLSTLLEKTGYKVTREYYLNDAGAQVEKLSRTLHLRYREHFGENIGEIPAGLYPAEYMKEVAAALAERDGKKWLGKEEPEWLEPLRQFAVNHILGWIKDDLKFLGVRHDVFSSEFELIKAGKVDVMIKRLQDLGLLYVGVLEPPKGKKPDDWEPRPQTLFQSTKFGDDIDRPLKKSDGSNTYFANDVAYHYDKYLRTGKNLVNCLGADHGGYVRRITAATKAVSNGEAELDCKLNQLINIMRNGEPVRMSKRAGTFVTLRDVLEDVGKDVFRFVIMTRKNDVAFDFDLVKVKEQSKDNPVFYVQYAHARICSVMRHAAEMFGAATIATDQLKKANFSLLNDEAEMGLIKLMAAWPRAIEAAALAHEPHRLCFYIQDLAAAFHSLWNKGKDHAELRFLIEGKKDESIARLAMIESCRSIIESGLSVFGVQAVKEMSAKEE
ncbi:MAG: arginine--tRNA ligase [Alphaproteobacteria bacterium]|nr:MAG: arginine--tRNA ligase [Alphaproteobacteria bacterium]